MQTMEPSHIVGWAILIAIVIAVNVMNARARKATKSDDAQQDPPSSW